MPVEAGFLRWNKGIRGAQVLMVQPQADTGAEDKGQQQREDFLAYA